MSFTCPGVHVTYPSTPALSYWTTMPGNTEYYYCSSTPFSTIRPAQISRFPRSANPPNAHHPFRPPPVPVGNPLYLSRPAMLQ